MNTNTLNKPYSKEAQPILEQHNTVVLNNRLSFTTDARINHYKDTPGNYKNKSFTFKKYFSYVGISNNCLYIQYDMNKKYSTYFEDNLMIEAIPTRKISKIKYISNLLLYSYRKSSKKNGRQGVSTSTLLDNNDKLAHAIRSYVSLPNIKIVFIYDFGKSLSTNKSYLEYNTTNEELNYQVILKCKWNIYGSIDTTLSEHNSNEVLPDKEIGYIVNSLCKTNNTDNILSDADVNRVIELLQSRSEHNIDLHIPLS